MNEGPESVGAAFRSGYGLLFHQQWPVWVGGFLFGLVNVFMFAYERPWSSANGIRNSFFGVPVTGTQLGNRPQDHEFKKNIWKAAQKHMREVHGRKIIANGAGGWKIVKISD